MIFDLETVRVDFENCYIKYEKEFEDFIYSNSYDMIRLKKIMNENLHYTSDEEYFKFRRNFNKELSEVFILHRDNINLSETDLYEIERYHQVLKGIEAMYFEKAVIKENEIINE